MPTPKSPVIEGLEHREATYAKDQPQYNPLPCIKRKDGLVLSRWTFSEEERAAIARGEDLYLMVLTYGEPLQPVLMILLGCNGMDIDRLRRSAEDWQPPPTSEVHGAA